MVNSKSGEGSFGGSSQQLKGNPLLEGNGVIQTRTLQLDFPRQSMEGKALSWYCWLMDSSPIHTWEEFVKALKIRFGPSTYEDPAGTFTKL
ncbi:hypothetical protein Patl1_28423 [Pistacia atlantica]|uniref:Uncharacterized protein n=1 Tax=Pistacia atlantica TaxID=434234 RepID=A0ACC1BGX6_9ROSI|nr:hypothetical protein Patl1_28423 [Pistacia atlantica]